MRETAEVKGAATNGAETLLCALRVMGVERIFASPGSDWAPVWEALARPDAAAAFPSYTSSRHEETAIAMASGYAKATGRLPAVILHTTVGALHATMAMRAALHERVPMVVLAGESVAFAAPGAPEVGRQWLRLLADTGGPARLVESCAKCSLGLNAGATLGASIVRACQLAMAVPRGPVFVSVPMEMLLHPAQGELPAAVYPRMASADAASVRELAAALVEARNPILITEELGKSPYAVPPLVELAEALGAPVFEAWHPDYVNFPRGHALYGGIAVEEMPSLVEEADLVFLVEAVAPWHPPGSLPRAGTRVATLGEDPLHSRLPLWNFRADLVVTGEAGASLAAIVEEVGRALPAGSRRAATERWSERNARVRQSWRDEALACARREPIDTRWVMHELNALLPRDAIVVNETITHRIHMHRLLDRLEPGDFYESSYGGLGMGLGTALGIKAAHPTRPVVVLMGDGALHYNPVVASFGAAQEHGLPLMVVLFDNSGYLSQKGDVVHEFPHGHAVKSGRFVGTSISPRPDYPLLARAYGGWGERVESPHDLREVAARGLAAAAHGQLALVHVILAPVNPGPS